MEHWPSVTGGWVSSESVAIPLFLLPLGDGSVQKVLLFPCSSSPWGMGQFRKCYYSPVSPPPPPPPPDPLSLTLDQSSRNKYLKMSQVLAGIFKTQSNLQ